MTQPPAPPPEPPPAVAPPKKPTARTLEDLHRDITFANQYRLEFIKHTMSLAAAVFVFTLTFKQNIIGTGPAYGVTYAFSSWLAMIVSLMGGLAQLSGWDRYYMTWRDYEWRDQSGQDARRTITAWRRFGLVVQIGFFITGLVLMAIFCALNM
ncbi:MAG TPA: hypothetical protein VEK79_05425 [Thermoanaerobaculia bacterium]|nr:hypothetical protein [Thermoanaerobaculia bacterium]